MATSHPPPTRPDAPDQATEPSAPPVPDEPGPRDVPDEQVIEKTLPSPPSECGSR